MVIYEYPVHFGCHTLWLCKKLRHHLAILLTVRHICRVASSNSDSGWMPNDKTFSVFKRPVDSVEEENQRSSILVQFVPRLSAILTHQRCLVFVHKWENITGLCVVLYNHTWTDSTVGTDATHIHAHNPFLLNQLVIIRPGWEALYWD